MNYEEAMQWIEDCNKLGSVPGLDNMANLTEALHHPEDSLHVIHVAGTNGKGSVSTFIAAMAHAGGKKVGRYISPTIFNYQERFQINSRSIGKKKLAGYLTRLKDVCDSLTGKGLPHPTSFEIETALAFLYFKDERCDLVVLEAGMGGRLDATNIIKAPEICVLTSISMDHMQMLGNDLTHIAEEKCGIIKKGTRVVSAPQLPEVENVIRSRCDSLKIEPVFVDETAVSSVKRNLKKQSFRYKGREYSIGLLGSYQILNACLALETMKIYENETVLSEEKRQKALLNAEWPGRFQLIHKNPYFVVDGAHNVDGARSLMESIELYFTNRPIVYIMGMFRDKEYEKVAAITCPRAMQVITVATPNHPRALPALDLAMEVRKVNQNVTTAASLEEAVEMAYLFAGKEAVIVAFGSLSFLGKLIEIVSENKTVRSDTHGQ